MRKKNGQQLDRFNEQASNVEVYFERMIESYKKLAQGAKVGNIELNVNMESLNRQLKKFNNLMIDLEKHQDQFIKNIAGGQQDRSQKTLSKDPSKKV